ncbi:hypothetical protein [Methylobacter sp. YRD-M1]|uniref:hypothetical protein n=1 Tax=Methylobacter sp. YRD-M1 TaxID=2911520 RepID=UPI00227C3420|nr:hypothetical protein [Methylobacter sp. YRD-M1]WAK02252.1 hypothetical protein LZ558_00295 [Methylobacter sp. YRD-M1]
MKETVKNIWSLDKDPSIKAILIMLQHEVGPNGFMLLDENLLDAKAVRIIFPPTQRELAAYVYSYAQREAHYGLDLEFPYLIEARADDQTIRLNDLTAEEVLRKVVEHLEIRLPAA